MTCEELTSQIAELRAQSDQLNQDAIDLRVQINSDYSSALATDNYGDYPSVPIQLGPLQTRVSWLGVKMPPPNALIALYNSIVQKLMNLDGIYASLRTTNDSLGSMMSQYTDQQCEPPL